MKRPSYALLLAAVYGLLLCAAARGATLGVGPSEPYHTIPDAVAHAVAGDTVALDDGAHALAKTLELNRKGLILKALNPGKATIRYTGPANPRFGIDAERAVHVAADGITIDGITFAVAGARALDIGPVADVTLHNLRFDGANTIATWTENGLTRSVVCGGYWAIQAQGTTRLTLDTVTFGLHASYEMMFDGAANRDVHLVNVTTANSVFQHPCRLLWVQGITFDRCRLLSPFAGPGVKHVGGLSARGGTANVTINDSDVQRGGYGAQNADEPTVQNVRLNNCRILDGYAVYRIAGLWINGRQVVAPATPPATAPSTQPADVAKALGSQLKSMPGMPPSAAPLIDQLAGMVK